MSPERLHHIVTTLDRWVRFLAREIRSRTDNADPSNSGQSPNVGDGERPPTELDQLCGNLTKQQAEIAGELYGKKFPTKWDTLATLKDAFRDTPADDAAVLQALKRMQTRLAEHYGKPVPATLAIDERYRTAKMTIHNSDKK